MPFSPGKQHILVLHQIKIGRKKAEEVGKLADRDALSNICIGVTRSGLLNFESTSPNEGSFDGNIKINEHHRKKKGHTVLNTFYIIYD